MTWIDWLIVLIPLVFVLSVGTIFIQRNWVELVYPFPQKMGWQEPVGDFLATSGQISDQQLRILFFDYGYRADSLLCGFQTHLKGTIQS